MVKCVRLIAREAMGHELIALVWTHLKQSGLRFCSGSTNSQTPMPKSCSSVCRKAWRALLLLANCELSNAESNSGALKLPASWCSALNQGRLRTPRYTPPPSIPTRCAHDQLAGFQIDQTQGEVGICAPALSCRASTKWKKPISRLLPDSPWPRAGSLPCESGSQSFSLLRMRCRWHRIGLRCCDGGLFSGRGRAQTTGDDVLVRSLAIDTEWEGTGYEKKKGSFAPELHPDRY